MVTIHQTAYNEIPVYETHVYGGMTVMTWEAAPLTKCKNENKLRGKKNKLVKSTAILSSEAELDTLEFLGVHCKKMLAKKIV